MAVTRFEDLKVWQQARALNKRVYQMTSRRPVSRDFGFVNQSRRAAISVMNNVAEGFERYQRTEFLQYLSVSKGSAGELRSMLYAALDMEYITQAEFDSLYAEAHSLSSSLGRFRASLERSPPPPHAKKTGRRNAA